MAMRAKTPTRRNAVFVDDAQVAKARVRRDVVASKSKRMKRLEPAVIGMTTFVREP